MAPLNLITRFLGTPGVHSLPKQVISTRWEDRNKVLDPSVNLFCWQREPSAPIQTYLAALVGASVAPIRLAIDQKGLSSQLAEARMEWDTTGPEEGEAFWEDVYRLTADFLTMASKSSGTLHLKVVHDDACRKFHTDGYSLRLFTTYYGPGTEWLPEKAVNRLALGKSNERIVKDPDAIQQMGAFDVGILKGEPPKPETFKKGIVHRSPPIQGKGLKRLILRIDL